MKLEEIQTVQIVLTCVVENRYGVSINPTLILWKTNNLSAGISEILKCLASEKRCAKKIGIKIRKWPFYVRKIKLNQCTACHMIQEGRQWKLRCEWKFMLPCGKHLYGSIKRKNNIINFVAYMNMDRNINKYWYKILYHFSMRIFQIYFK